MAAIVDTTVVSNFAAVARLDLLQLVWPPLYLAHTVFDELRSGSDEGYRFLSTIQDHVFPFHTDGWLHLVTIEGEEEVSLLDQSPAKLHRGEAVSLAIAANRGWIFLTDDRAARNYAATLGVAISGTLGVLLELISTGTLNVDEANHLLGQMVDKARYQSPVADLRVFLTST